MWNVLKRWRWAALILGLLVVVLGYSLWPRAREIDVGVVDRGPMAVGVTDDGVTREEELYVVSAPVTGFASRIELEAGDHVRKGQVITRMHGRPTTPLDQRTQEDLRGQLASAWAAERSAAAALAQSRRDLARVEELAGRGFVSRANHEAARTRVATDRAALERSRAEVRRISGALDDPGRAAPGRPVPVTAPVSGSVLLVPADSENIIAEGTPLMMIGDPAKIEVVIDLLSREAVRVSPGDRVEITQWGGPHPLIGHVTRVEPYGRLKISALGIEEQRVNVIIGFDPKAAGEAARLGHGYQVDATIILWSDPHALRLPIGALFRGREGGWHVFVVEGGRARERSVRIGHLNDEHAEVLHGVAQGAKVILNPGDGIEDGARVRPRQ
ncbi:efflux RND transporter periplasmic adaptor subunit [Stakelama marina]|uniref:Efflux RND transporter periplasmic adaptor subunit n=1 Tax=Stakelama marina TaxID=2826939 RepID=A0A8T4IBS5_9SPHN|nr:efflux RND transporter periplasmic adaptor subunit [Stakelama marina]MBR0552020.1 efflux RND transporter periplasmic adaptor subunit [Stakelama marina]